MTKSVIELLGVSVRETPISREHRANLWLLLLLLVLLSAGTNAEAQQAIIVTKPVMQCPKTKFDDANIQASYDLAWDAFTEEVEQASKALTDELSRQADDARIAGNLDLLDYWNSVNDNWKQTEQFEWDADSLRKQWAIKFGKDVTFPHPITTAAEAAAGAHKEAIAKLENAYKSLVKQLVQKSDQSPEFLPKAREAEKEIKDLVGANAFRNQKRAKLVRRGNQPPISIVGRWTSENFQFIDVYQAHGVVTRYEKIALHQKHAEGVWKATNNQKFVVTWTNGPPTGWKDEAVLFPTGIFARNGFDPAGQLMGTGLVAWGPNFDWRGQNLMNVNATPEAKRNVAGEWRHPKADKSWKITEAGEFVEASLNGDVKLRTQWNLKTDDSYECLPEDHRSKIRFWVFRDVMAQLEFDQQGRPIGFGRVLTRK